MIALVRVDSRLIHGQVVEAWLPQLDVARVLVADDAAARSPLTRMAMGLAVPSRVAVDVLPLETADFRAAEASAERVLLLVREVRGALRARERGVTCGVLNLGNIHFAPGRVQVTPSVFLTVEEVAALRELARAGVQVELRTIPKDRPMTVDESEERVAPLAHPRPKGSLP